MTDYKLAIDPELLITTVDSDRSLKGRVAAGMSRTITDLAGPFRDDEDRLFRYIHRVLTDEGYSSSTAEKVHKVVYAALQ